MTLTEAEIAEIEKKKWDHAGTGDSCIPYNDFDSLLYTIRELQGEKAKLVADVKRLREALSSFKVWGTDACRNDICPHRITLFYSGFDSQCTFCCEKALAEVTEGKE